METAPPREPSWHRACLKNTSTKNRLQQKAVTKSVTQKISNNKKKRLQNRLQQKSVKKKTVTKSGTTNISYKKKGYKIGYTKRVLKKEKNGYKIGCNKNQSEKKNDYNKNMLKKTVTKSVTTKSGYKRTGYTKKRVQIKALTAVTTKRVTKAGTTTNSHGYHNGF